MVEPPPIDVSWGSRAIAVRKTALGAGQRVALRARDIFSTGSKRFRDRPEKNASRACGQPFAFRPLC
jgi:hypothetical protein